MDALVAGMNGDFGDHSSSGEHDFLGSMLRTRRGRATSTGKRFINPLYQPPLPTPPSGIKIGIPPSPASSASDHELSPTATHAVLDHEHELAARPLHPIRRLHAPPPHPDLHPRRTITEKTVRKGSSYFSTAHGSI
jgi:hypothetical protein